MGSFERLQEGLGGFGIFCEVLQPLDAFVMLREVLALERFAKVLKSLGRLWEAVGCFEWF